MRVEPNSASYVARDIEPELAPTPDRHGLPSLDALTQLLLSLETEDQAQLEAQSESISAARDRLDHLEGELMADLAEALRYAQQPHKKHRQGWFSRNLGGVVDFVAKVVAKGIELNKDLAVLQSDLAVSVFQNFDDPAAARVGISRDLLELTQTSETEQAADGFLRGTAKLAGDVLVFQAALVDALARGAVRGDRAANLVLSEGSRLYASFEQNIWENPDFWTVVERSAQAAAVAGAVSTGGALALVAGALVLAIEAENRYGYLDEVVGRKAAPWVELGMQLGLMTTTAISGGGGNMLRLIEGGTAVLRGVHTADQGIHRLHESRRRASEVDAKADVLETRNRMDQIRRLIDRLIQGYEEASQDQTANRELSAQLVQAHAASNAAVVFPA